MNLHNTTVVPIFVQLEHYLPVRRRWDLNSCGTHTARGLSRYLREVCSVLWLVAAGQLALRHTRYSIVVRSMTTVYTILTVVVLSNRRSNLGCWSLHVKNAPFEQLRNLSLTFFGSFKPLKTYYALRITISRMFLDRRWAVFSSKRSKTAYLT